MTRQNDFEVQQEADRILNFLAGFPGGTSTCTRKVLHELLMNNNGRVFGRGECYDIRSKNLGAGVYRVYLTVAKL